jgi:hypothetical protein
LGGVFFKEELNASERCYTVESGRSEARLEHEAQKAVATAAYMKKVQDPPEIAPVFWAVDQGKDLKSRGV